MLSWSCGILESKFWIILPIALTESATIDFLFFNSTIDGTRKWTVIGYEGALSREKGAKEFSFLFEIFYEVIIVI